MHAKPFEAHCSFAERLLDSRGLRAAQTFFVHRPIRPWFLFFTIPTPAPAGFFCCFRLHSTSIHRENYRLVAVRLGFVVGRTRLRGVPSPPSADPWTPFSCRPSSSRTLHGAHGTSRRLLRACPCVPLCRRSARRPVPVLEASKLPHRCMTSACLQRPPCQPQSLTATRRRAGARAGRGGAVSGSRGPRTSRSARVCGAPGVSSCVSAAPRVSARSHTAALACQP